MKMPVCIDLFCGLGGWAEGFLAEGWDVVGYDIEAHDYGTVGYPGKLVIRDVLTIHGSELLPCDAIVASPPCTEPSYRAMPWRLAKALNAIGPPHKFIAMFEACFRIQREASEAAGRHIPMVVENVVGAQRWVGRAKWHYGSYYLWGDVPALMPITFRSSETPTGNGKEPLWKNREVSRLSHQNPKELLLMGGLKNPGFRFDGSGRSFQSESVKNTGGSWFNVAHNTTSGKGQNPDGRKLPSDKMYSSKSPKRKMASAMIAKIPFPLAVHIAQSLKPLPLRDEGD